MTLERIIARIRRLKVLAQGFNQDILPFKDCNCPLLRREHQDNLVALNNAQSGVEIARNILAQAQQRITRSASG
jgi:hypothetical protein